MTEQLKRAIERLLPEHQGAETADPIRPVRGRLAADVAEALGLDGAAGSDERTAMAEDRAAAAAFLDGRLGADREAFVAALARDQNLRADLESAAALIEAVDATPSPVPQHLLAQARAQFAPAPAPAPGRGLLDWALSRWQGAPLRPRGRAAWAMAVAVLAVIVLAPGTLLVLSEYGAWSPWHQEDQPSAAPQPDDDTAKACGDAADRSSPGRGSEQQATPPAERKDTQSADDAGPEDPCHGDKQGKEADQPSPKGR
jgi:hypothetical protein